MSDAAPKSDATSPVDDTTTTKKRGPRVRGSGRAYSQAQRREMELYVVELRREGGVIQYAQLRDAVRAKFGCGFGVAEKAVEAASHAVRDEFYRQCQDAPKMILDGYVEIYQAAMRKQDLREARKTLDSLRDMFGIKGATRINVNVSNNTGDGVPTLDELDALSDEQLALLAQFDARKVLDVAGVELMDDVASAGVDAVAAAAGDNGGNEDDNGNT